MFGHLINDDVTQALNDYIKIHHKEELKKTIEVDLIFKNGEDFQTQSISGLSAHTLIAILHNAGINASLKVGKDLASNVQIDTNQAGLDQGIKTLQKALRYNAPLAERPATQVAVDALEKAGVVLNKNHELEGGLANM